MQIVRESLRVRELNIDARFIVVFAILAPLVNAGLATLLASLVTEDPSNRFVFGVLAASASYIAVPAAMKITVPQANPGLFLPMTLAVTFPVNITVGMPSYYYCSHLL